MCGVKAPRDHAENERKSTPSCIHRRKGILDGGRLIDFWDPIVDANFKECPSPDRY